MTEYPRATDESSSLHSERVLTLLKEIQYGSIYEPSEQFHLPASEYHFLKKEELIHASDIREEDISVRDRLHDRYSLLCVEANKLTLARNRLKTARFIFNRQKKLQQLEEQLGTIISERDTLDRQYRSYASPTGHERHLHIATPTSTLRAYARLTPKGKDCVRKLSSFYHEEALRKSPWLSPFPPKSFPDLCTIVYGSPAYADLLIQFDELENKDHTPFFQTLLQRLSSLSDPAAHLVSKRARLGGIGYEAYDSRAGGYAIAGDIQYVRNFVAESYYPHLQSVPPGYTGFTFDQVRGPRYGEGVDAPTLEMIAVEPQDLGKILIEHKKRDELSALYEPSVERFFSNWTYDPRNPAAYWIYPAQVPKDQERDYVMHFRHLDPKLVHEIERQFPEAKQDFDALIGRIIHGRESNNDRIA